MSDLIDDIEILVSRLEAMLFISNEPKTKQELTNILNVDDENLLTIIEHLAQRYDDSNSAIELRELARGYQLFTRQEHQEFLEEYISSMDNRKLSTFSIEVLSIIAYCQPITRNQVSEIRGANSDNLISSLVKKGYICEVGCQEDGGATLFGTTDLMLDSLGILSIDELPNLEQFAPDAQARLAIAERLGAIREQNESGLDNL